MTDHTPGQATPPEMMLSEAEQQQLATDRLLTAIDSMAPDQLETAVTDPQVAGYVMLIAARHMCPFCLANWPVERVKGEYPVMHRRWKSLRTMPSADRVPCKATQLRALAEGWTVNPIMAAEGGTDD